MDTRQVIGRVERMANGHLRHFERGSHRNFGQGIPSAGVGINVREMHGKVPL